MKMGFKSTLRITQFVILMILTLIVGTLPGRFDRHAWAQTQSSLLFIENTGQFAEPIRFQTLSGPATVSLTDNAIWLTIIDELPTNVPEPSARADAQIADRPRQGVNLKLTFVKANPQAEIEPFDRLDTHVSYFGGSDSTGWQTDVPVWGGVRYVNLYPGYNLEITGENGQLRQRLVPNQSTAATTESTDAPTPLQNIALQIEGADALSLDAAGQLRLTTALGEFTWPLLQIEQADTPPPTITDKVITYPFSAAPPPLNTSAHIAGVADLLYSTFLGGVGNLDTANDLVVDAAGSAYVAGQAYPGFPTTPGAFDPSVEGVYSDAFVAKLTPDGSSLDFATFLGGTDFEVATSLKIDEAGNVYMAGYTVSPDFPTSEGAFDRSLAGESDAFAAKFNATGTDLLYATLLGGSENEFAWGIDVNEAGQAYVTGFTPSTDFPTTPGAFQTTLAGWYDVYVVKLNADASNLIYSTLVGGESADYSFGGLTIDPTGSAYVTGYTHSPDFPTTPDAFDTSYDNQEIFVCKLNPDGSDLTYSTYLGGTETEYAEDIVVNEAGEVFLTGTTRSLDFPVTAGAFDTNYNSEDEELEGDAFVAQLNAAGSTVIYATYLGGSGDEIGQALVVDDSGTIYVTGETDSPDFPTTPDAFDTTFHGASEMFPLPEVFVSKLAAGGTTLGYSTFLGTADGLDQAYGIDADDAGNAYVAGATSSPLFPVTAGAFDPVLEGFKDAFVFKLATGSTEPPPEPTPTPTPVPSHNCAPTVLGTVSVGNTPRGIALDVARQRVYVANYGSGSVSAIDSSTHTLVETIADIPSANGIVFDGLHKMLWVTNYDNDQVTPIQVNDTATGFTVLDPVNVGDGPWGVVFDPIFGYLYVANSLGDSVSVVDVAQRTVVATLTENFSQPFHLAATPVTGKVYVANSGNNTVTVIRGTAIAGVVPLYDSAQPYGIAVDEGRNLVYVATVATNRIVAIGTLNGVPDQFLGWAAFYRGFGDRNRPVPLRMIAVNSDIGPDFDGGHLWATTSTADGSELNQALLIPKGWSSYFHIPLPQNVSDTPSDGIAVDSINDRVYISSGGDPGIVTVMGDHATRCPGVSPAMVPDEANGFDFRLFSRQALSHGDATGDGVVDIFDLSYIAARYDTDDYTADINRDGVVDIFDLTLAAGRYGQTLD